MKDLYRILGLAKNASPGDIKKSYRRLARKLHPDSNPQDRQAEEKFKDISAAYDLLSDPKKRKSFDKGEIDAGGAPKGRPPKRPWGRSGGPRQPRAKARKPFENFFSKRAAKEKAGLKIAGTDVSYTLKVDFLEAARGARKRVSMTNGKRLEVIIPPGTGNGQILRLRGQGMEGVGGGKSGDANVEILVKPHPLFTQEGKDIHMELPVTLGEAVLGGSIEAPTIDGAVSLSVPQGSNTGTTLRLKGKGLEIDKKGRGDQYIKLKIVLPAKPDKELIEFAKSWKPKGGSPVRRKSTKAG